ncbi:redoxin domain-containing protein [Mesorhizobium sp. B2-4-15]|uniref:redoxin family protein n=1 Tax=Mesorhizobium sp. B2-4-15 TaxID=2589934 RepID=UPI00114FE2BC|nr:redoxin family protein [Mesorhizobium sp. B2-4-15]TPK66920.1 redoxin domain-containing protein [Mesorhizobium sp. B2-4-15]
MRTGKLILAVLLAAAAGVAGACIAGDLGPWNPTESPRTGSPVTPISEKFELGSIGGPTTWINSQPLTVSQLRGKVVLVDFWTYTCINWRRTLPYLQAWHEKYRSQGLIVIGIHTPEFSFERDLDNVRQAVKEMHIDYPVLTDNDEAVWRAFGNQLWPTLYLIDSEGRVKYRLAGERSYERAEPILRKMLSENGGSNIDPEPAFVKARGFEAAADWTELNSPETYTGYEFTHSFASPQGMVRDRPTAYKVPSQLGLNEWALDGRWTGRKENVVLDEAGGSVTYRFHARDLHLVMGLPAKGTSVKFRILIDGKPPGAAHGLDVDENGDGTISELRLYQLVRQPTPVVDRQFEIKFFGPGVEVYDFTFG